MKYQYISNLREGDEVNDYFLVSHKDLRELPSGEKFLGVTFRDKTGEIGGFIRENPVEIANRIEIGDVVAVKGTVKQYKDRLQIHARQVLPLSKNDYSIHEVILPTESKNSDIQNLLELLDTVKNPWLKKLIEQVINDTDLLTTLSCIPAGKKWHHELRNGLVRHCIEMIKIADTICELYPNIDRDLLITACFLHDIGKIKELTIDSLFCEYTDEGKLLGHLVSGAILVSEKIKRIDKFPEDLRLHILHCIISHHGQLENGSPVVPKTLEANLLFFIDNLSAQANSLSRIEQETIKKGEKWSEFINLISRQIWTKRL